MSRPVEPSRVLIIGAGLAGALMAVLLARRGRRVVVYERRPDPRAEGFIGGRSINLALSARGINGLRAAGVLDRVMRDAIPMRGRMMHAPTEGGDLHFQPYSSNPGDAINSVSRGGLNLTLLEAAAEMPGVELVFGQRCIDVDLAAPAGVFVDEATGETRRVEAGMVLGADGAFSAVRGKMQIQDRFDYDQSYLEHGYKELHIPAGEGGRFLLEKHALHIWPRGASMMIALPNPDGSFTCTLFWPFKGEHSFEAIRSEADVLPFFRRHYPDAVPLMPTLVEDYMRNPTSALVTIRCRPWRIGRVALLGDAAHAIVPFFGQGMNAAFEDCVALDECLARRGEDAERALAEYEAMRKENADAIADMAIDNFVEMRDHVASAAFLFKKRLEQTLHKWFPDAFLPLYNMVSFSLIPYAEARRRAARQKRVIRGWLIVACVVVVIALLGAVLLLLWPGANGGPR